MSWHFLNSGACPAAWNMALDEQLARAVDAGAMPPTLRVYAWQPYAVSLGYHQDKAEFDTDAIDRDGLQLVRRPTGGKAILHAEELTYSVVMPVEPMGPREIYRWINIGLLQGLELLGVRATLARVNDHFPTLYRTPASAPCFASSARSEIQVNGRKLVGSAQRRYGKAVLQHGSLLLGPEHKKIVRYLAPMMAAHRADMEQTLQEKTIDTSAILGRVISFDEAVSAIRQGFVDALHCEFRDVTLNDITVSLQEHASALLGPYE